MSAPRLSAVVVARDEQAQLGECLAALAFCDEIVAVLDRCTDASAAIARGAGARAIEGAWEREGPRRNAGLDAATGDWILEVDADERVPPALAAEIRAEIARRSPGRAEGAPAAAHYLIGFDNHIGGTLVRRGWGAYWGVSAAVRLFTPGAKRWGAGRVHPAIELRGARRRLDCRMVHLVDRDFADMLARLERYTALRARDLRETGEGGGIPRNALRLIGRFWKCYALRGGWREGGWGFAIALFAGLYPLLACLRARLEEDPPPGGGDTAP